MAAGKLMKVYHSKTQAPPKSVSKAVKQYVKKKVASAEQLKEYRTGGQWNMNTSPSSNAIQSNALSYITKGDNIDQREANAVVLKTLRVKWNVASSLATQTRVMRILVLKENLINSGTVSGTGIFQGSDYLNADQNGVYNRLTYPINTKAWQVLHDKTIIVPPQSSSLVSVKSGSYSVKLNKKVMYYPNDSATIETSTGHIYICGILGDTTVSATVCSFNFFCRVTFKDANPTRTLK